MIQTIFKHLTNYILYVCHVRKCTYTIRIHKKKISTKIIQKNLPKKIVTKLFLRLFLINYFGMTK